MKKTIAINLRLVISIFSILSHYISFSSLIMNLTLECWFIRNNKVFMSYGIAHILSEPVILTYDYKKIYYNACYLAIP